MSNTTAIISIAIMSAVTYFLRALPFVAFRKKTTPKYITFLGKYLPFASIAMLVVYCLKDIQFTAEKTYGIPELVSVVIVAALHLWKKNTILSVIVGTTCYMLLIRIL